MDLILSRRDRIRIITERDGPDCFLCGEPFTKKQSVTLDHWIPKSAGGTDLITNLRLAHKQCNILKGDLIPENDFDVPMREPRTPRRKKEIWRSEIMARFCVVCENGRKLDRDDLCSKCGSPPGPPENPRYLKRRAQDCDHAINWCWACSIGIVEKRSAMVELMLGSAE